MSSVCEKWGINFLNISTIDIPKIGVVLDEIKPRIIISSVERKSNVEVQKQLGKISLAYVALDEAQVSKEYLDAFKAISSETLSYLKVEILLLD